MNIFIKLMSIVSLVIVSYTGAGKHSVNGKIIETAPPKGGEYKVNVEKSIVEWWGKQPMGQHNGTVKITSGSLVVEKNKIKGGNFIIDMNSLICSDITDAEENKKLIDHFRNNDFFSVAKYPTANLEIISATDIGGNNYAIKANLTIKGISNEVSFIANIIFINNTFTSNGDIVIDRTKWGIKYKSKTVFSELADKFFIYDEIVFKVNLFGGKI